MSDVIGNSVVAGKSPGPLPGNKLVSPELQRRIASSVVMISAAVLLSWAGGVSFVALVLAVALVLSWEWGHLVRGTTADRGFLVHALAISVAFALAALGWPSAALAALTVGVLLLALGAYGANPLLSASGVVYAGGAGLALIWIRADAALGFLAVLFLFLSVWTNDTMAFAFGKLIKGPKLWPAVSPNKTWAGFLGGLGCSGLIGLVFAFAIPGASSLRLGILGLILGAVAVAGDLLESAIKRRFGVKDASDLIPGHGGVMDRMDGIVAVALFAAGFVLVVGGRSPASALLIGS